MFLQTDLSKREAPRGRFPFFVVLAGFLLCSHAIQAQEVEGRVWLEALGYLSERGAHAEADRLRAEALKHRPEDIEIAEAFLELLVTRKDRKQLNEYVQTLVEANGCRNRAFRPRTCGGLRTLWTERLAGVLFYESSAPRWEKARRALEDRDCRFALAEFKEIEAREGSFPELLSKKIEAAECLKDVAGAAAYRDELDKMKF